MSLPPAPLIRTVLGDIRPDELGFCDAHDHLFVRTPQRPGDELDDLEAARVDLRHYRRLGGRSLVQWTPYGLGRRLGDLPELSRYAGVHLVAATGLHQARHYDPELLARVMPRLTRLFVEELTTSARDDDGDPLEPGPYDDPVRAGIVKAAGSYHGLDQHARAVLFAAAEAHHETGAPIGVHLEGGTAGGDVIDALCDARDVPPASVILAHVGRWPEPTAHADLAATGVFLQFDGPSPRHHATDWRLLDCLAALVEAGYGDRLLLGGDQTGATARGTGEGPGMEYLLRTLAPRLERRVGADVARQIFEHNPARAFSWRAASA